MDSAISESRQPPRRRRLRRAIFIAITLFAALGLAELLQWTLLPAAHPLRRRPGPATFTFHTDGVLLPGISGETRFTTESHGFRYPREITVPRPAGTIRIFCLGGSTTECTYLDDADAWPARCEAALRQSRPGATIEVINAGFSGMTSADHRAQLVDQIIPLQPTGIVLMAGLNDHLRRNSLKSTDTTSEWRRVAMDYSMTVRRAVPIWRALTAATGTSGIHQFDPQGETYRRLRNDCAAIPIATDTVPFDALPDALPAFEYNVTAIANRCLADGIQLVLITHPSIWSDQLTPADLNLLWMRATLTANGQQAPLAWHIRETTRLNDWLRQFGASRGLPLVDADQFLPKTTDVFYDDCHFNIAGSKRLAHHLADAFDRFR